VVKVELGLGLGGVISIVMVEFGSGELTIDRERGASRVRG
jgi:hypothetical protein